MGISGGSVDRIDDDESNMIQRFLGGRGNLVVAEP
jgi:hypothetical protein